MDEDRKAALDETYRAEGWGKITDAALGIRPSAVESQARDVARWAHAEIGRLRQWFHRIDEACATGASQVSAPPIREAALDALRGKEPPDRWSEAAVSEPLLDDGFEWAIVEVFGHRRHAGRAREEERFGAKMLRIDVPTVAVPVMAPAAEAGGSETTTTISGWTTHWYGGSSIFSYTLTDEATAIRINRPSWSPQRYIAPPFTEEEIDMRGEYD